MRSKKVNTRKALESIDIMPSALYDLSGDPERRKLLLSWGINPDNYYPEFASFINEEQWFNLLKFYARKVSHPPAQDLLRTTLGKVRRELYL
jgi:hypothetical protein